MRVALGSDARSNVTDAIVTWLNERGHEPVLFGMLAGGADDESWASAGRAVGAAVSAGDCGTGIVCCWTGTGVAIAANKVAGVRAALCTDAATAAGAREWNDANVLALSLRLASIAVVHEMLEAWFGTAMTRDPRYRAMIAGVEGAI